MTMAWDGVQFMWVVLGILGAALGVGSSPPMSSRQCWTAIGSGIAFACLAPQAADWAFVRWAWFNPTGQVLPTWATGFVAFFFGVGGMYIVPMCVKFWSDPKGAIESFMGLVRTVRGKGE